MNILVTGGAGYIGSHTAWQLHEAGHNISVIDNLSTGHKWAIKPEFDFFEGNVGDSNFLETVFLKKNFDAVIHFAGSIEVEESTRDPLKYYENNTFNTLTLLKACRKYGVNQFVFSSTAATYGEPGVEVIAENCPQNPINPYGQSKLQVEKILKDLSESTLTQKEKFRFVALRYFNVAGARLDTKLGQSYPKSTHLIKIAVEAVTGIRDKMYIFGDDYKTVDGTCVRDYIHVEDLAAAHLCALEYLERGGESDFFNCGYTQGYSVKEVIDTVKEVSKVDFEVQMASRRAGDPPALVAASTKIKEKLGWQPKHDDLRLICKTALSWEKAITQKK